MGASPYILPRQLATFLGVEPDSVFFVRNAILIVKLTVPSNSALDREREQDFGLENSPSVRNNAKSIDVSRPASTPCHRDLCHRESFVLGSDAEATKPSYSQGVRLSRSTCS